MIDEELRTAAARLLDTCREHGLLVATAESCTGGLVAATLTEIAGSSDVFDRGFVTYSNAAKITTLGVLPETLDDHGAVSRETAIEMAQAAIDLSDADLAVAITGIAGPGGGSPEKPVGLVQFAAAAEDGRLIAREEKFGDLGRAEIRRRSVLVALAMLQELADGAG